MISDESHPLMIEALRQLKFRVQLRVGLPCTPSNVDSMHRTVRDHRAQWRMKGVDFPELVPLVIYRVGIIDWVRADLDSRSIVVKIVNFVRAHTDVTMPEVVEAFRRAYPSLHPDDIRISSLPFHPQGGSRQAPI